MVCRVLLSIFSLAGYQSSSFENAMLCTDSTLGKSPIIDSTASRAYLRKQRAPRVPFTQLHSKFGVVDGSYLFILLHSRGNWTRGQNTGAASGSNSSTWYFHLQWCARGFVRSLFFILMDSLTTTTFSLPSLRPVMSMAQC